MESGYKESSVDILQHHTSKIATLEAKVEALEALKADKRLNRIEMVFFAAFTGATFFFWLAANTKILHSILEGFK